MLSIDTSTIIPTKLYSIGEIAKLFGCSRSTVEAMRLAGLKMSTPRGMLKGYRCWGRDLVAFLEARYV